VLGIIHRGSFIVRFDGFLHSISVFRWKCLLHCGDLRTAVVEWFGRVNIRNVFERDLTAIVKLMILATNILLSNLCTQFCELKEC